MADDAAEAKAIRHEAVLCRVRMAVTENKIKLWQPPYYNADNKAPVDEGLVALASSMAAVLELDDGAVFDCLLNLQANALEKIEARQKLAESNTVTLKVKLAGKACSAAGTPAWRSFAKVEVDASCTGRQLAEKVAAEMVGSSSLLAPGHLIRLISGGRMVSEEVGIGEQGLKPGSSVMAIVLGAAEVGSPMAVVDEQRRLLSVAKEDARLLGFDKDRPEEDEDLSITDQTGQKMELPRAERKALILAMSLHEKGKAALRLSNWDLALLLLLEALNEYNKCNSSILQVADNYALLNLDVAWCYLKLGNLSELPNAEQRLLECERQLIRSYGADMERVQALKGGKVGTSEEAVIVRMHLLQAIVLFHTGHLGQSADLFREVERDLGRLRVPEAELEEVVAAGFSSGEARAALRVARNDVAAAVKYAQEQREQLEAVRTREVERSARRKKFGRTREGDWVNLGYLATLVKTGFSEDLAAASLRHCNNDMNLALEVLSERPEVLFPAEETEFQPSEELVASVMDMGFPDEARVVSALTDFFGNVEKAVEALTSNHVKAGSKNMMGVDGRNEEEDEQDENIRERREEARDRMQDDLETEGEYLDLTLDEEAEILAKYKVIAKF